MKVKKMSEDDLIHLRVDVFFYNKFIENAIELKIFVMNIFVLEFSMEIEF